MTRRPGGGYAKGAMEVSRGFLSQPFDDGGLSNPCFTEQHWVVFGASAEDLNYALRGK
jgi:hypothetical protein